MAAITGGVGNCLSMSLSALKRLDPYISSITDLASQVALYTFNNTTNEWVNNDINTINDDRINGRIFTINDSINCILITIVKKL